MPVVVDIGSGLLAPRPALPDEPDAATALRAGAALVTASGDKLLGGPQAGLLLGRAELVERLRRHPLARALRVDKLTLAALEATLRGPADADRRGCSPPTRRRCASGPSGWPACSRAAGCDADGGGREAAVGGGGAPGVVLPSAAVACRRRYAAALRGSATRRCSAGCGRGRCLLDLRAVRRDRRPGAAPRDPRLRA